MFVRSISTPRFLARRRPKKRRSDTTPVTVTNLPPVWGSLDDVVFDIVQGETFSLKQAIGFTDPENNELTLVLLSGAPPTGVIFNPATGAFEADGAAPLATSGDMTVSASDTPAIPVDYWTIPTLQNEIDFYANPNKPGGVWTRPRAPADMQFNFASSPNPLPAPPQTGTSKWDIHEDFENDDLWTWQQQVLRGYTDPLIIGDSVQRTIPTLWRDRWLQYYQETYLQYGLQVNDSFGDSSGNSGHFCHAFVTGLCLHAVTYNDTTSYDAAVAIGDYLVSAFSPGGIYNPTGSPNLCGPVIQGVAVGVAYERVHPRVGLVFCHLAQMTGLQYWIDLRDKYIERFMHATDWMEAPALNMHAGTGFYHTGGADVSHGLTAAQYAEGKRMTEMIYTALHAEFLWRAYLQTGRADVKDRLIKLARFHQYYAFNPAHTIPATGGRFGHFNGVHWRPDVPPYDEPDGDAWSGYGFAVVNSQVFGYKLTGDSTLLDSAKYAFRQCSKFEDGWPHYYGVNAGGPGIDVYPTLGTGHHVEDNQILDFIDTTATSSSVYKYFTWDKGALQSCYQLFENGGNPVVLP